MATPFEPTGPEVPSPPFDIPTPSLPTADFVTIGAQLQAGANSAQAAVNNTPGWLSWIAAIVGKVIVAVLTLIESIIAKVLSIIFKIWNSAESGTDQISAAAVSGIFNTPVSPAAFQSVGDTSGRQAAAGGLIGTITAALGAPFTGAGATNLTPSYAGANQFMQTALNMAIEGWLQGWLFEAGSLGYIKHFGDLKDILERSLGIGRLSRRVMGPPVKILVEDPFTWFLNNLYRPTQLGAEVAIREFIRGNLSQADLDTFLGYAGIPTANIPAMVNQARPHLGVGQLMDLVESGYMDPTTAQQELQNDGYDTTTAGWVMQAEQVTRQKAQAQKYLDAAEAGLVARKLDLATFNSVVDSMTANVGALLPVVGTGSLGVTPGAFFSASEGAWIKATAALKRWNARPVVSLGTAQQLLDAALINGNDFGNLLALHGFVDDGGNADVFNADVDAAIAADPTTSWAYSQELNATAKGITAAQAAQTKAANATARAAAAKAKLAKANAIVAAQNIGGDPTGVSIAKFETLVKDGLKTIPQYQAFLAGKGLDAANIAAFTTVLQNAMGNATTAAASTALVIGASKAKGLSLAQLTAAVKNGLLDLPTYESSLQTLGYSAEDATILGQVLQDQIAAAALKASTSAAAAAALGERHVSLAQEERAVLLGLQPIAAYTAMLQTNGFAAEDVDILTSILASQLATTQAAAAKKAAASGLPGTKQLNVAQIEKLVRAGQASVADYQLALTDAGYDATSAGELVNLLNLTLANDAHLKAATGRSSALQTSGGLSLSDIKTAVKLGVVPISVYDAALTAAGVAPADATVLHAALVAQIAATAGTAATVGRVTKVLEAAGLSFATIVQQVLSGTTTVAAAQAQLTAAGVAPADASALATLWTEQLSNQAATGNLVAGAETAAKAKGLSLTQSAAAVKAGVSTIQDYQTLAASLGYDAADVAVLVATEADKLGIAAPGSTTPPTTP